MLRADWLGLISPVCTVTGAAYVLLIVDYFSRFIWAKVYQSYTAYETINMLREYIAALYG